MLENLVNEHLNMNRVELLTERYLLEVSVSERMSHANHPNACGTDIDRISGLRFKWS